MKKIPLHSLILILSPTNSYNYEFASKYFHTYEILSFNNIKEELVGDNTRNDVNKDVAKELQRRIRLKLKLGERVVVESKSAHIRDRMFYGNVGKNYNVPIYYLVHDEEKNVTTFHEKQKSLFETFENQILMGDGIAEVIDARKEDISVVQKLPNQNLQTYIKKQGFKGVTAIGDVHSMLQSLKSAVRWATSRGHFIVFLGDIIDYGPRPLSCVDEVYSLVMDGRAGLVYGNHERKLDRWIDQSHTGDVRLHISEATKVTTDQIESLTTFERANFELKYKALMKVTRNHFVIGDFLFTHGAASPDMFNIFDNRLKEKDLIDLAIFGEIDENNRVRDDGYPNRVYKWVNNIPKGKTVIVGHDIRSDLNPLKEAGNQGGEAIFLDTGAGKGGSLSSIDLRFKKGSLVIENYNKH